jgi:CubicO group peptidase (beta-lactamase class C family)
MRPAKPIIAAALVLSLGLTTAPFVSSARGASAAFQASAPRPLDAAAVADILRPIREKHAVAAMVGAIVTSRGVQAAGVVGLRKAGTETVATLADRWHLGSDTKAMTAALLGRLVERGLLKWETKPAEVFPELAAGFHPGYADVTVLHLLSHRAGLAANLDWGASAKAGSLIAQRLDAVKKGFAVPPLQPPGSRFFYSNLGYVVAGAMAERLLGKPWEEAIAEEVFAPLGIKDFGFGGTGTLGQVDQPWGHSRNGKPVFTNGPLMDNPPVVGPAGRAHMTIGDWALFVVDQLRGARGEAGLLKPETYKILHTPPLGGDYALGWGTAEREWGGGRVLTHNGSNTMNFAVVWAAPAKDFAVLVCVNQDAALAADEAADALIKLWREAKAR